MLSRDLVDKHRPAWRPKTESRHDMAAPPAMREDDAVAYQEFRKIVRRTQSRGSVLER